MIPGLKKVSEQLDVIITCMDESNILMRKLTTQLELISLPPDMVNWARDLGHPADIAAAKERSGL